MRANVMPSRMCEEAGRGLRCFARLSMTRAAWATVAFFRCLLTRGGACDMLLFECSDNRRRPMAFLNPANKNPLYQQLYEILRAQIARRELKPGDTLPTEMELMAQYGAGRVTVRQALDLLVQDGLIYRERARGTFVAHPRVEHNLVRIVSFTTDMQQRGFKAGTKILGSELIRANAELAEQLQVEQGAELARLERLRLADREPMSVEESFLVHCYCPGILKKHNYATYPLRDALERDFNLRLVRAKQTIRATAAPPTLARVLGIPQRAPLLHIERVSYTQDNVPLEFLRIWYRADRYALFNELQG
jgi:GntR family transcriptional regulator